MDFKKVDDKILESSCKIGEKILKKRNDFENVISKNNQRRKSNIYPLSSDQFSYNVVKYMHKIKDLGYTFGNYLKQYMETTMGDQFKELKKFLDIDLEKYDLNQIELFLVGSLPGAFDNSLNYSFKKFLQFGNLYLRS
jgi:hypothetical protein